MNPGAPPSQDSQPQLGCGAIYLPFRPAEGFHFRPLAIIPRQDAFWSAPFSSDEPFSRGFAEFEGRPSTASADLKHLGRAWMSVPCTGNPATLLKLELVQCKAET